MPEWAEVRARERSTSWKMNKAPQQPKAARSRYSAPAQSHMEYGPHIHRRMNAKGQRGAEHAKETKYRLLPRAVESGGLHGGFAAQGKDHKRRRGEKLITTGHDWKKPTTTPLTHAERYAQRIDDEPSRDRPVETRLGHTRKRKSAREGGEQRMNAAPAMLAARAARACVSIRVV